MHNDNKCRHLKIKENTAVYRRGGAPLAALGSQRYQFLCSLPSRRRTGCPYMTSPGNECPDYKE